MGWGQGLPHHCLAHPGGGAMGAALTHTARCNPGLGNTDGEGVDPQLSVESGCCYSLQDIPSAPGARDGVLSSASPPPRPLSSLEAGVSLRILPTKHIMISPEGAAPSSPGKSSHKVHSGWGGCPNLGRGLGQASLSQSDCQKQKAQPKK